MCSWTSLKKRSKRLWKECRGRLCLERDKEEEKGWKRNKKKQEEDEKTKDPG